MATAQWLYDNPKILAYVPRDVRNQLYQFRKQQGIKSISEAVNEILRAFFEQGSTSLRATLDSSIPSENVPLEIKLAALNRVLKQLVELFDDTNSDLLSDAQKASIQDFTDISKLLLADSKLLPNHQVNPSFQHLVTSSSPSANAQMGCLPSSEAPLFQVNSAHGLSHIFPEQQTFYQDSSLLVNDGRATPLSEVQTLINSLHNHPACIFSLVLRRSRLERLVASSGAYLTLVEAQNCFNRSLSSSFNESSNCYEYESKFPYDVIRNRLNEQCNDIKNPLDLDYDGVSLPIRGSRGLAELMKQLRTNEEIIQAYVIPLSMLAKMLEKAGLPVTSDNLWKVKNLVQSMHSEIQNSFYKRFLERVQRKARR